MSPGGDFRTDAGASRPWNSGYRVGGLAWKADFAGDFWAGEFAAVFGRSTTGGGRGLGSRRQWFTPGRTAIGPGYSNRSDPSAAHTSINRPSGVAIQNRIGHQRRDAQPPAAASASSTAADGNDFIGVELPVPSQRRPIARSTQTDVGKGSFSIGVCPRRPKSPEDKFRLAVAVDGAQPAEAFFHAQRRPVIPGHRVMQQTQCDPPGGNRKGRLPPIHAGSAANT